MSFTTARRTITALASVAALAVAASPASAKSHHGPVAPPKAHNVFHGSLTKGEKAQMATQHGNPAGVRKAGLQGKDSVTVFCGSVMRANWGYWIKCHVVYIGGPYGYEDWYEYDYWNGSSWSFWFDALS
jgi:hypothetical protein